MKLNSIMRFVGVLACAGVLNNFAAGAATEKVIYSFKGGSDGLWPEAGLLNVNGTLYGTTIRGGTRPTCPAVSCGTVFSIAPDGTEKVLYAFSGYGASDGSGPAAGLINVNGTLYGTTILGGASSVGGTVFSIDPQTGTEKVLYSFCPGQINCTDGEDPSGSLINVNGMLYGVTNRGGANNWGTVFSVDPKTGVETVVYSFKGGSDGGYPTGGLLHVGGTLYGTTTSGGGSTECYAGWGCGTVFALDPTTGKETVLHSFASGAKDGAYPQSSLIDVDGKLYGVTANGGAYTWGTVFSVDSKSGAENLVYTFKGGSDGGTPTSALIDVKGTLYSTTQEGGSTGGNGGGWGTVFAINLTTGRERVLHAFGQRNDGAFPGAALIDVKGTLYGTTTWGGTGLCNCGAVFSITP